MIDNPLWDHPQHIYDANGEAVAPSAVTAAEGTRSMGTRWRGVLAPINQPTGDGRRMAVGAFTHRPLPLPLRWQRAETQGHDDASVIGSIDVLRIDNEAGHVWGEGELFDDVSPATNPKLAEDVNEAKYLLGKKTIGPSVDPGSASAVAVLAGTDQPVTEQTMMELMLAGATEMPPQEMLFTNYEIAGATLVPVPAFAECRPFELDISDVPTGLSAEVSALVASAQIGMPPEELFRDPALSGLTPITRRELPNGWVHVFGHIAEHATCLVGMRHVCLTPPYSEREYSSFHRYHQSTDGDVRFPLPLGRLTAGFGSLENTCRCCPGNDDHACANISFGAAVAHHDRMQVLAYGRVGEDEANNAVWFSGIEAPGVDARGRSLLSRKKISGDWREVAGSMELSEILVLNRRNPGFPLPRVSMEGGRQRALTAAGVIHMPLADQRITIPEEPDVTNIPLMAADAIDYDRLGASVADALMAAATVQAEAEAELAFNPRQRRGKDGKWIKGGGSSGGGGDTGPSGGGDSGGGSEPYRLPSTRGSESRRKHGEFVDELLASEGDFESDDFSDQAAKVRDIHRELDAAGDEGRRALEAWMGEDVIGPRPPSTDRAGRSEQNQLIMETLREISAEEGSDGGPVDQMDAIMERLARGFVAEEAAVRKLNDIVRDEIGGDVPNPPKVEFASAVTAAQAHTGAMIALRMTEQDAARLAVASGLPMDELHTTLCYLGDADAIAPETREQMIADMTEFASGMRPFRVDGQALSVFNPGNSNDRDTALVLGLTGGELEEVYSNVSAMSWDGVTPPDPHRPWSPHVTLEYTNDLNRVKAMQDRVGPVTFDRLRLAFGGEVTDIPLGGVPTIGGMGPVNAEMSLRARAASALMKLNHI